MALEQMEGFELAGRTVSSTNDILSMPAEIQTNSSELTLSMRRVPPGIPNKTPWMKQAVRLTLGSTNT